MNSHADELQKKEVIEKLRNESVRWKQTQYFVNDSQAKLEQAKAADNIQLSLFSRSMIARTNQLFFGFLDAGPLNTIGFGVTGIQAGYLAYNRTYSEKIEAAKENIKIGEESTKNVQNDLQFLVMQKYIFAQFQEKRLESADIAIKKSQEVVRLAKEKNKAGFGVPIDVARSEALLEKDKIKRIEIEASLYKAQRELSDIIGEAGIQKLPRLVYRKLTVENLNQFKEKLTSRHDVLVTEYQLKALDHLKKSVEAERGLHISTFAEIGSVGTQAFGLTNSPTGSIGVQFEIPILDGGLNNGKKREILNQISHAEFEKKKVQEENNIKFEIAVEQLRLAQQAVEGTDSQMKYAQTELDLAVKKIKFGSAGNLELVNAQNNYALALEANSQAIYTYELSKLNFYYTTADLEGYLKSNEEGTHG